MPKLLIILSILIIFNSSFAFKVVIDPGHGGHDKGATSNSLYEAHITLKVSKALYKKIQSENEIEAILTRKNNYSVGLKKRTHIANNEDADLFISIHANSSTDPRAKGAEFYFQNQLSADEESMFLANKENDGLKISKRDDKSLSQTELILEDMNRNYAIHRSSQMAILFAESWQGYAKKRSSPVRQAPFYVINHTNMPSVLVEIGYITNPKESKKLTQSRYQTQVVNDIYNAIIKYKNTVNRKAIYKF